jgi:protein N-terminal asparagine amidohydrolase
LKTLIWYLPRIHFKEQKVSSALQTSRYVYVFQREYATVDPALVDYVGTDEATTCGGIVIRNRKSRMTCVAHMDFTNIVDGGFKQMMSQLVGPDLDTEFDVHVIGAFEDFSPQQANGGKEKDGYSFSLCAKIVETLLKRPEKFHIQTLFVLGRNTQLDFERHARPIFTGFLVETANGSVTPACFDRSSRCPDDIVRRIRLSAAYEDLAWDGKLLDTYDTVNDKFVIAPCCWTRCQKQIAKTLQKLSDREILFACSTSPFAEASDFVENEQRKWEYLIKYPEWEKSFPQKKPRVFERTADGSWKKCSV